MSYCQATTRSGRPCRAHHVWGSFYCFWHEPLYAGARQRASMKGGKATLEDMARNEERREERREYSQTLARLQEALKAARSL
jgi:hypothetical protein